MSGLRGLVGLRLTCTYGRFDGRIQWLRCLLAGLALVKRHAVNGWHIHLIRPHYQFSFAYTAPNMATLLGVPPKM